MKGQFKKNVLNSSSVKFDLVFQITTVRSSLLNFFTRVENLSKTRHPTSFYS